VTTLRSGLCYRKSVCLSVIFNVRAPYSEGLIKLSAIFLSYFVPWPFFDLCAKFYVDRPTATSPSVALNAREVAKYSDGRPIEGYISYLCHVRIYHLLMSFLLLIAIIGKNALLVQKNLSLHQGLKCLVDSGQWTVVSGQC